MVWYDMVQKSSSHTGVKIWCDHESLMVISLLQSIAGLDVWTRMSLSVTLPKSYKYLNHFTIKYYLILWNFLVSLLDLKLITIGHENYTVSNIVNEIWRISIFLGSHYHVLIIVLLRNMSSWVPDVNTWIGLCYISHVSRACKTSERLQ